MACHLFGAKPFVATRRDPPTEDNAGVWIIMILFAHAQCAQKYAYGTTKTRNKKQYKKRDITDVGHYKELSTQRPGSPKNTTQQHDVSVQSTFDRRPIYYSQKMDPSSPNANSIMWTHTSLEINIKFKIK